MAERIPGGLAAGMRPQDFDQVALRRGIMVEMEHTSDPLVAQEIAMDHLVEDSQYYDKLSLIENAAFPLGAYTKNPDVGPIWAAVAAVAMGASAYHGYKRNEASNPVAWALWWGLWGALIPVITVPIAIAQGFGEPEGS